MYIYARESSAPHAPHQTPSGFQRRPLLLFNCAAAAVVPQRARRRDRTRISLHYYYYYLPSWYIVQYIQDIHNIHDLVCLSRTFFSIQYTAYITYISLYTIYITMYIYTRCFIATIIDLNISLHLSDFRSRKQ